MPQHAAVALLHARQAELLAGLAATSVELDGVRDARADATADDEHDPEGSTLSGDWSRIVGLRADLEGQLAEVQRALDRVSAGSYGVCVACGRGIPSARLEARPAAERCVQCAS
jgi:DnaK suppressor protein